MEMIQFDEHIFQMDWFNHQLVVCFVPGSSNQPYSIHHLGHLDVFGQLDDPMTRVKFAK